MITKEQLQQILGQSDTGLLDVLRSHSDDILKIINHFESQEEKIETALSAYDNPSWAYKQAHINGSRRVYKLLRQILTKESNTNG